MMEHYNFLQARKAWATNMTEPYKEGTMLPQNQEIAKQDSPILSEMNQMEKNFIYLSDCLNEFMARVSPVMSTPSPEQDSIGKEPRGSSVMVNQLRAFNAEISRLTRVINDARDRVEL